MKQIFLKSALCVALATAFVGCGNDNDSSGNTTTVAKPAFEMQLLHFADMDSSDRAVISNVENFSALVSTFKKAYPKNTLLVSSGDNFIPGPRMGASDDDAFKKLPEVGEPGRARADIAFMNALGVQATVVGNHDLDEGTGGLKKAIKPDDAYVGAKFPYLSANIDFSDATGKDSRGKDKDLEGLVQANGNDLSTLPAGSISGYGTLMVNGEKIGIIGASTPTLPQITNTSDLNVLPSKNDIDALAKELQKSVDKLIKEQGVNKVIMLAHMQTISTEKALAKKLKGVDIIVAGGSNTILADSNDTLRKGDTAKGNYPYSTTSAANEPVLVVNTDGDYNYLGRLVVGFDKKGVILPSSLDEKINGAYASTDEVVKATKGIKNPIITKINTVLNNTLNKLDGNVQGKSSVYLNGYRGSVRTEETNLGNLTADANLWYAKLFDSNVQISIKNGGGIRDVIGARIVKPGQTSEADLLKTPTIANAEAGKKAGDISQLDIQNSLRFNNKLWLVDVTGEELHNLMEHAVSRVENVKGQFPQIAGFKFSYDPSKQARVQIVDKAKGTLTVSKQGERIRNLALTDAQGKVTKTIVKDGVLQADAKDMKIRAVTLNFIAGAYAGKNPIVGGDGYPFTFPLTNLVKLDKKTTEAGDNKSTFSKVGREQDALSEYLQKFHNVNAYNMADTPKAQDKRIQNLSARTDTVLK